MPRLRFLVCFVLAGFAATSVSFGSVFGLGAFAGPPGKGVAPEGWTLGNKWAPHAVELVDAEGVRTVRFSATRPGSHSLHAELPIAPSWKTLRISAELRCSDDFTPGEQAWTGGRVGLEFKGRNGERVGDWPRSLQLRGPSPWRKIQTVEEIPAGADVLAFSVGMFASSGVFEVRRLSVTVEAAHGESGDAQAAADFDPLTGLQPGYAASLRMPTGAARFDPDRDGTPLFPRGFLADATFAGQTPGHVTRLQAGVTPGENSEKRFGQVVRVKIGQRPENEWDLHLHNSTPGALKQGEFLLFSGWGRAVDVGAEESASARAKVYLHAADPNNRPRGGQRQALVSFGPEWRRFQVPLEVTFTGEGRLHLLLGYSPVELEFADLQLHRFPAGARYEDLPADRFSYAGMEPDARWRGLARGRIDIHRKGDLSLRLLDPSGNPLPSAAVQVRLERHDYAFGSALNSHFLPGGALASTADAARYQALVRGLFNEVVCENAMKWNVLGASWLRLDEPTLRKQVRWMVDQGLRVRGHTLIWPGLNRTPEELRPLWSDRSAFREVVLKRVRTGITQYPGLFEWDVTNESVTYRDYLNAYGHPLFVDIYREARKAAPDVSLVLNEHKLIAAGGDPVAHVRLHESVRALQAAGAPLDGLGFQCHMSGIVAAPERIWEILEDFTTYGLPVKATEFDVDLPDPVAQAVYLRDFMTAWFAHPSTNGIVMWGFWEGAHWKPNAALWAKDWSAKPAGKVWLDLVHNEWITRADLVSNARGEASVRAFYGRYQITGRSADGRAFAATVDFPKTRAPARPIPVTVQFQ